MSRKTLLAGSALVAMLVVGCSGTNNGGNESATSPANTAALSSTSASTTGATSSSSSSSATSSGASTSASKTTEGSDDSSSTVVPAQLDAQSVAWFSQFCGSLTGMSAEAETLQGVLGTGDSSTTSSAAPTSLSPDEAKAAQTQTATMLTGVGDKFKETATSLGAVAPPTIAGGDVIASTIVSGLSTVGDQLKTASEQFSGAAVTDAASLAAAQETLKAGAGQAVTGFSTAIDGLETTLTPEINAAVEEIPECKGI